MAKPARKVVTPLTDTIWQTVCIRADCFFVCQSLHGLTWQALA
ncbi:hypothetical protein [Ligilactobacillus acidipiscis]|uniref:Uncharacterized protein n=1 Tax=Ligilactobacillus acidipiscis TaxID=89059 RepID=A0A1K1KRP3_9LACO|nr:hypothetical protein [Ligilactobacillus acidipiscis]SFV41513.1 hypothetical protein LAC1533_2090 [Ligilactobacillus acidipiscis]